jgi:nicotinamidase-related amidase
MRSALIVGDLQLGIVENYSFARAIVPAITDLLPRARAAGVLVVFVHFAFRPNGADVPGEPYASFFRAGPHFHEGSHGTQIAFDVHPDDVTVLKRRTSAFAGTDLDLVLRARGVDSLALTGVATSAMVAATLYDASDRGYQLTVLRDGCADHDLGVHEVLVDKVFRGRGADIRTCAEWPQPPASRAS